MDWGAPVRGGAEARGGRVRCVVGEGCAAVVGGVSAGVGRGEVA
ncbi:hypothetical protein [Frankia sp. AgKG'84/4]|nr:hypothetical protein [Frankia sp. AgKG'84/4]